MSDVLTDLLAEVTRSHISSLRGANRRATLAAGFVRNEAIQTFIHHYWIAELRSQ